MDFKDFLEKAYEEVSDNVKFSEAKNAALITLNSALIAASTTQVFNKDITFIWKALIALVTLSLLLPLIISLSSFKATIGSKKRCEKKKKEHNESLGEPKKFMYYSYICEHYKMNNKTAAEQYFDDIKTYFDNAICSQSQPPHTSLVQQDTAFESPEGQLASQIVDLSVVAYRKFKLFNVALLCEMILFIIGGIGAFLVVMAKLFFHYI